MLIKITTISRVEQLAMTDQVHECAILVVYRRILTFGQMSQLANKSNLELFKKNNI